MLGFFISNTPSVPELKNYDATRCISGEMRCCKWVIRWNVLDKFQNDKLFYQDDTSILILNDIVLN